MLGRRPAELYDDDMSGPSSLAELPSVIEHQRLAVISTALRLAEDKDRLAEQVAILTGERDSARAVIEEVRKIFASSRYFAGHPVKDVVTAAGLLASAYEAERSRP